MSRVNEILEQITDEDADAVLYSVMLSFLKRKAKEYGRGFIDLSLTIDEESESIDLYYEEHGNRGELLEELKT